MTIAECVQNTNVLVDLARYGAYALVGWSFFRYVFGTKR